MDTVILKDDRRASSFRVDRFAQPPARSALGAGASSGPYSARFVCRSFRSNVDQAGPSGPIAGAWHGFLPGAGRHHVYSGSDRVVSPVAIYLEEHRISVSTMVEVGIVATLREVLLTGAMQVDWRQMLVLCAFILTLGVVLRYAGVRTLPSGD